MRRLPSARHAINTVRDRRGLAIIVASRGRPRNAHPNKYQPRGRIEKITSLTPPPPPPSSLLRLDLCSITGTFSFSLSLPLCFCMRFLVTGESSCADGRRFGRGVATILFIRRRKPPASPWRRECEAERSGQMARTKRATMEGGREGTSGNSFRILYPASATRQLIHPPSPCGRHR